MEAGNNLSFDKEKVSPKVLNLNDNLSGLKSIELSSETIHGSEKYNVLLSSTNVSLSVKGESKNSFDNNSGSNLAIGLSNDISGNFNEIVGYNNTFHNDSEFNLIVGISGEISGRNILANGLGLKNTNTSNPYTHIEGKYNVPCDSFQHIVGGGSSDADRKNIQTLDWNGNMWTSGNISGSNGFFAHDLNVNRKYNF